jgi:predicted ATP-grasp superfamily ATP-dependent carboligase
MQGGFILPLSKTNDVRRVALIAQRNNVMPFIFDAADQVGVEIVSIEVPGEPSLAGKKRVTRSIELDIFEGAREAQDRIGELIDDGSIAGLMTLREEAVPWVAETASRFNLPGISYEAAVLARDKNAMRAAFKKAGCNTPLFELVTEVSALHLSEIAEKLGFPLVVKPRSGFSSTGVVLAQDLPELMTAVEKCVQINAERLTKAGKATERDISGVLIEQFIDGPEHTAEIFCRDGKVTVLTIGHKGNPQGPCFEEDIYRTPAPLNNEIVSAIVEEAKRGVAALGINFGPAHCELRLRNGTVPYILEIGARVGGSGTCHFMVETATGVNYLGEHIKAVCGMESAIDFDYDYVRYPVMFGGQYIIPLGGTGVYEGLNGAHDVEAHPDTAHLIKILPVGTIVRPLPDFPGYPGFIMSRHKSYEDSIRYHKWLDETIKTTFAV